jgi:hypothetical protein
MFSNFYQLDLQNEASVASMQMYDEASTKIGLKIGPSLVQLRFLEVHVLLISSLNIWVLPILFAVECGVVNRI